MSRQHSHSPGTTSSIESGTRLNGSLVSDNKCDLMVDRSTTARDEGNVTGSRITVNIRGSKKIDAVEIPQTSCAR